VIVVLTGSADTNTFGLALGAQISCHAYTA
jgi:hypothetical protein